MCMYHHVSHVSCMYPVRIVHICMYLYMYPVRIVHICMYLYLSPPYETAEMSAELGSDAMQWSSIVLYGLPER